MGVPKFFRWISERYPAILSGIVEELSDSTPEIDNLYLDMNGIIHNCSHDNEELTASVSSDIIVGKVLCEVDRLVTKMVRPKAVLFIAVDGVAPRAKLNQQRSRRFRSSRDRVTSIQKERAKGSVLKDGDIFDSNCITPGTAFMYQLSIGIRDFIERKMKGDDPVWTRLKVFFSGSEVPGEGEHKIMAFIRDNRALPGYSPNTRHCINGADADMIMLSLATHEPYFLVLRDVLERREFGNRSNGNRQYPNKPHLSDGTAVSIDVPAAPTTAVPVDVPRKPKNMQFVRINVLREYLVAELLESLHSTATSAGVAYDVERVIDDFVFLTFFVGNDFLPHLPALDIGDSAFDVIFDAYKTVLAASTATCSGQNDEDDDEDDIDWGDEVDVTAADAAVVDESRKASSGGTDGLYLVRGDDIDLAKLELVFALIGVTELTMYTEKEVAREAKEARLAAAANERQMREAAQLLKAQQLGNTFETSVARDDGDDGDGGEGGGEGSADCSSSSSSSSPSPTPSTASSVPAVPVTKPPHSNSAMFARMTALKPSGSSRGTSADGPQVVAPAVDRVNPVDRELQYKRGYYASKFGFAVDEEGGAAVGGNPQLREVVRQYLLGLQWCLSYYSRGCVSWSWYYPYHYGPFLHDMVRLPDLSSDLTLELSAPFTPFQQLLACLPATSCVLLPAPYHWLMQSAESPLAGCYPAEFSTDLNGKRQEYEAVVLLPFIDRNVLVAAESACVAQCGPDDQRRNQFGCTYEYLAGRGAVDTCDGLAQEGEEEGVAAESSGNRDTSGTLAIVEHKVNTKPGECFESVLVPGTVTAAEGGLPGFPSLMRMSVAEIQHANRTSAANKGERDDGRGGTGRAIETKGRVGKSNFYSTGGAFNAERGVSGSDSASGNGGGGGGSTAGPIMHLPATVTVRLLLDDATNKFLCELAQQVEVLAGGDFESLCNAPSSPLSGGGPVVRAPSFTVTVLTNKPTKPVTVSNMDSTRERGASSTFVTTADTGVTNITESDRSAATSGKVPAFSSEESAVCPDYTPADVLTAMQAICAKTTAIFGPVQCALLPNCKLDLVNPSAVPLVSHDGVIRDSGGGGSAYYSVCIKFRNASHYDQVEEFVKTRLHSDLLNDGNYRRVFYRNRIYTVAIGAYRGADSNRFQLWLNNELLKMSARMPLFTARMMALEYHPIPATVLLSGGGEGAAAAAAGEETVHQYMFNTADPTR